MGRTIVAVLVGLIAAWITIMLCEFGSAALSPPPTGIDLSDPTALAAHIAAAPPAAMALVLAGWTLGAFDGGLIAALISRRHKTGAALTIGVLVVLGVIANSLLIPHPLWMTVAGLALPIPAAWLASRVVSRKAAA
ncbi:hypothetical protein [Lysobacter silvisoli]|uniref:Uncharacterized protein n=1 Tax=Lysobacter silvisoli TaxID=2293254 RepID=A0A371K5Q5_9GAMM|nr:hypothetical protein [Lysobacter silvisoli]RDZ29190.1 hypothetical protein DX914_08890 [Lysobacter silvisoli]